MSNPAKPAPATPGATPPRTDLAVLRRELRALPAKKRLDAIVSCPDVLRVVRSLPLQDLYATLREVGPSDALEVVELLHPRQVQGLLDLDGWRKDRIDPVAVGEWLEVLFAADPFKAATQIRGLDVELVTLLLKIHTRVYDIEQEEPPEGDLGLHSVTPDNRYVVVYDQGSGDIQLLRGLKQAVDLLFARDLKWILRLIQAVQWELPSSLEEEAHRWRAARLGDLGIPAPEEALRIFAWVDPDAPIPELSVDDAPDLERDEEEAVTNLSTSVLLPWDLLERGSGILGQAWGHLSEPAKDRVTHELMLLANHLHVALGGDLGDPGALRETVQQASDTVGLALSYLCQGDASRIPGLLERVPLKHLFQRGHSLPVRLQREFRARLKDERSGLSDDALLLLDSPLREVSAGILKRRPVAFEGLMEPTRVDFGPFRSLPEVAETARALTEAAFRAALLGPAGLGVSQRRLVALGVEDLTLVPPHGVLLATALLRLLAGLDDELVPPGPLDDADVEAILACLETRDGARLLPDEGLGRVLARLEELAAAAAPLPGAPTEDEAKRRARAYGERALRTFEDEVRGIEGDVDPRFLGTLWTRAAYDGLVEQRAERDQEAAREHPHDPTID